MHFIDRQLGRHTLSVLFPQQLEGKNDFLKRHVPLPLYTVNTSVHLTINSFQDQVPTVVVIKPSFSDSNQSFTLFERN
jgi:hypothetical protein